jgi:hypothetical protein
MRYLWTANVWAYQAGMLIQQRSGAALQHMLCDPDGTSSTFVHMQLQAHERQMVCVHQLLGTGNVSRPVLVK